jgi:hypothetical protein
LPIFRTEGLSVDEKLNEQFRYFRSEYVEAANTSGVAVPLAIVEDKSGQVYKFVYHGGPKYLFEVIQANLENIHLLRCSLSLLIIIITLLRRKIPEPTAAHKDSMLFSANTTDTITAWVVDTLAKIGDASAVAVCINVLITSYNPSVQELVLSLLGSILMVSDEAVAQMLKPYNSSGTALVDSTADMSRRNSNNPKRLGTAGRSTSVEAMDNASLAESSQQESIPKLKTVDFKKLNFSYNTMDYSAKKVHVEKAKKVERPSTCLSYVLSIFLIQKNRHLLAAGCADIILAMLRKNKRDMSEAIAHTPTCELPAIDVHNSKNETRKLSYSSQPEEHAPPANPLSALIIESAGLKLLLKFIFRYEKMNAQSKTATKAIIRESVSASLQLKDEYSYAHNRVFTAVCQLIAGSPAVAALANTLEGAEDLLTFTFNRFDPNDSQMYNVFVACTNALAEDKQLQAKRRAHLLAQQHGGGRHLAQSLDPGDIRLSDYLGTGREGVPDAMQDAGKAPSERAVTPKDLYNRLHSKAGRGPTNSVSPPRQSKPGDPRAGKKGKAAQVSASADGRLGSQPRREVLHESIELGKNMKVNFNSEYNVETEKGELYLLNSYDAKYGSRSNGELKALSRQANLATAQTPLSYNPDTDMLIGTSLESIGNTALKPITNPRPQMTEQQRREAEFLLGTNYAQSQSRSVLSNPTAANSSPTRHGGSNLPSGQQSVAQSIDSGDYYRRGQEEEIVFANSQDFFNSLRSKPAIPLRIEPKDVITQMEDLTVIRKKFQTLAEDAKKQCKSCPLAHACDHGFIVVISELTGCHAVVCLSAAKGKIEGSRDSQQDLIKRVYGPRKFKYYDPKAPSAEYDENGEVIPGTQGHSPQRTGHSRSPSARGRSAGQGGRPGIAPIQAETDYFASFSDASGTALQDLPIQPNGAGAGGARGGPGLQGMEGMDFSMDHLTHQSSATSDGPDVYGLRLENFNFDEQNLFDGFKPIFGNPAGEKDKVKKVTGPDQGTLDDLGIARKNKPDMNMVQTVDLILS